MKCFSLLVLCVNYMIFESSAATLLRGGNALRGGSALRLVEGQSALNEAATSVMQMMGSTLKAMDSSSWTMLCLMAFMLFLVIVSSWAFAMREASAAMADPAPERRCSGAPHTAPAGITVRPQTRLSTTRSVAKLPCLPDVSGMPADAVGMFQSRPSTAMWQGAYGPEVTQYRVWEDPNKPPEAESTSGSSSHSSNDEETQKLVNVLHPSFDSPPGVPQASDVKAWEDQNRCLPKRYWPESTGPEVLSPVAVQLKWPSWAPAPRAAAVYILLEAAPAKLQAGAMASPANSQDKPTLGEVVDMIGMGPAQIRAGLLGGSVWMADGAELLLISSVADTLSREWQLSRFLKGFVVTVVYTGLMAGNISSGPAGIRFGRREAVLASFFGGLVERSAGGDVPAGAASEGYFETVHDVQRCEEEYRKRMVFHEQESGPFAVNGEQTRRGVGAYAFHQIHSRRGREERQLRSCVLCARSCWLDDMDCVQLFVTAEKETGEAAQDEYEDSAGEEVEEEEKKKKQHGWKVHEVPADKVEWLHKNVLDVRRYQRLWPAIPKDELLASCVTHPSGKYEDGTSWQWLLNTKVLPTSVTKHTTVFGCMDCVRAVTAKQPRMPKFALANSLWIGRYPKIFLHQGKPLSPMTFLMLSLGRPVVQKIIAEPHKAKPLKQKQKGIRANTIAFPQAQLHEMVTAHLPPLPEEARRFLGETISIALDLNHAQWAEIPRDAYVAAARFLVTHNVAYRHLHVDEKQAHAQFTEVGASCEAVCLQATELEADEAVPHKLSGPADVSRDQDASAAAMAEPVLESEGNVEDDAQETVGNFHPFEGEDVPSMRCVAGEVTSGDLDVERVVKEFSAKLQLLMKLDLQSLPYLKKWQEEDKFDGELEDCKKDVEKRRDLVPVVDAFIDLHVRKRKEEAEAAGEDAQSVSVSKLPLTGSVMSRLPHYRLLPGAFLGCKCKLCAGGGVPAQNLSVDEYIDAFCQDFLGVCALSGHLHEHQATCFKYAPEGSRRKPQHCRFNFVHFVKLFREKKIQLENTSYDKLVEVVVARTGKPVLLPRWMKESSELCLSGEIFAGMVTHRGNLNYQDCRRVLIDGYVEDGPNFLDDKVEVTDEVIKGKMNTAKLKVTVNTKKLLAETFFKSQPLFKDADADVDVAPWHIQSRPFQRRASQRAGETMSVFLCASSCRALSYACKVFNYVELECRGAGDCRRVGDRFLTATQRCLRGWLQENLIEGLRSGIQTSFYTCDYTTKPALTCGPVLKHLTNGMQKLEERMQMEAETMEAKRLLEVEAAAEKPSAVSKFSAVGFPEQQEARKRLCRLWTSANHAVMHGHCLMAIHILTGREVIRTHVFWRLMMKRVLWGVFEEMRRFSAQVRDAIQEEQQFALSDIGLSSALPEPDDADLDGDRPARGLLTAVEKVELRTTSFYEDYLHRGDVEPLASMNFYVYGMHVSCVHVQQLGGRSSHVAEYDFAPHYSKARSYVQILHPAPRVPYLHGLTMPTKEKDPEMWSAVHVALLRKHHCLGPKCCGQSFGVQHIRKIPSKMRHRVVTSVSDRRLAEDKSGILTEWKATEAEMQTLAQRADATGLHFCMSFDFVFLVDCLSWV
eukprot:Skav226970  [mRNA]  locus=scaffold51:356186:370706:- [translate_table: standard]